ncbi:MAG: hypothetical protein DMF60_07910 [Acidobacteria bacterium]|nr:MAG: hypothetical protein DMF60_07910 [Acidobacteriota bacterium]
MAVNDSSPLSHHYSPTICSLYFVSHHETGGAGDLRLFLTIAILMVLLDVDVDFAKMTSSPGQERVHVKVCRCRRTRQNVVLDAVQYNFEHAACLPY